MGARTAKPKSQVFYKLKSKASENINPHFSKIEKEGDKYVEKSTYNQMFGVVSGIEYKEVDYNGKKFKIVKLILFDGEENSVVDMPFTNLTYSILNCLMNDFDISQELSFTLMNKKRQYQGKDYYDSVCYINLPNNDLLKWSLEHSQIPKAELVINPVDNEPLLVNGDKVYDKSKLENFWIDKIENVLIPKFNNNKPNISQTPKEALNDILKENSLPTRNIEVDDSFDDLPF